MATAIYVVNECLSCVYAYLVYKYKRHIAADVANDLEPAKPPSYIILTLDTLHQFSFE